MSGQWLGNYAYRKQVTIPAENVSGSGSHTNFPILIDITDNDLISISNNGLVHSDNGYDIGFSQDNLTLLNHEIESYSATTGRIVAWVQIPSLSTSSDNTVYIYFGYPQIIVDPSTPDTWDDNAYVAVYHLEESSNFQDAAANQANATNQGSTDIGAKIGNGQDFQQGDTYDRIELGGIDVSNNAITLSAWINPNSFTYDDARIISKANGFAENSHWWMLSTYTPGEELRFRLKTDVGNTRTYNPSDDVLSAGSWHYVTAVWDGDSMELFRNGSEVSYGEVKSGNISTNPAINVGIGNQPDPLTNGQKPFDGIIDEVRIQKVARSDGWLQTEFDNQDDPTNFYSVIGSLEILNDLPCDAVQIWLLPPTCICLSIFTSQLYQFW